MDRSKFKNHSSIKFFLLVLLLSIPFWILAAVAGDLTKILPTRLPISALMTFCPLLAAAILVYKEQKYQGVKELLKTSFDFQKIKDKKWYTPVVFLMPTIAALSYLYLKMTGKRQFKSEVQQELMGENKILRKAFYSQEIFWVCD
jgi:uncharacterized protein